MITGLPHGCKPPPLTMQHPCNPPQKPRTMAAVSPLHQVVPPQAPPIASYEGGNMGFNATSRTSSFAAALRKLAKQAVDPVTDNELPPQASPIASYEGGNMGFNATPRTSSFPAALRKLPKQVVDLVTGEKDLSQISPVSSPVLNQTPKRSVPSSSMFHQGAFASTSPPVVTIAPSRPVATHTSDSRKVMDLSTVTPVNNTSSLSNGHIQEPIAVKMDSTKSGPRPAHAEKWEEPSLPSKGHSASSASSQVRPHATIAPLPRPDDSLTSSRGFQPYRGSEESRNTLPHHISLFDHHPTAVSYPYTPAFLPPPHLSHPAYRFDDPLYLERYSLLRPPVMPYPQPGMMAPPAAFYPNSRYTSDLIAQSLSLGGPNSGIINHERLKQQEEERRMREKEMELDQNRNKEQQQQQQHQQQQQERQREKEQQQKEKESREREQQQQQQQLKEREMMREKREKEKSYREKDEKQDQHVEHKKERSSSGHGSSSSSSSSSKRTESPSVRTSTSVHNSFHPVTTTTSTPLNLVMQQHPMPEPHKKETELWMPWQQPVNHHNKDSSAQDSIKHPAFRPQDNQNHLQPVKENHSGDKVSLRFSPTILNEKKPQNAPQPVPPPGDPKKHPLEAKKFDSIHHHIAELSSKDHGGPHEWRHEKLQKACTNNHRKTHESKKAKESSMSNHHQQRKAVNGAIIKQQQHQQAFQNEGMHARLLESEKCRIELNGQMLPKPPQPPPNVVSVVANYKTGGYAGAPVMGSKEVMGPLLPKTYVECYAPVVAAPVVKSTVDLTPVVSKLDLEAKNLLRGESKLYEDDGRDEIRLRNFLIITKGPPLKLDANPQKLKFLKLLGLTTHYKRKKIELDMYLKRRKILFEDSSVAPLSPEKEEEDKGNVPPLIEYSVHTERLAEQLRSETTPEKLEFFFQLGLTPITLVKKEEKERIRRIVEEERVRRHYRMLAKVNRKASPRRLFVPKSEAAMKLDHLRKMREQNALFANSMYSKSQQDDDVFSESSSSASSQRIMPKHEQVPYFATSDAADAAAVVCNKDGVVELSYPHKSFNKYSFKRGHSLKNEFRYDLCRPASKNNHALCPVGTDTSSTVSCVSVSTQVEASLLSFGAESTLAALKNAVNWPGLESIMEAFYRHQHEQSNEKTLLTERCHFLRKTQEELKKEADGLTKHMTDLLKSKRDLEEETFKYQRAIDRIKQCLQVGR